MADEGEHHSEPVSSVGSPGPLNIMANDEQQSSATSPELRTIPPSVELLSSEKSDNVRASGMSVESWNSAEIAELQTSDKSIELKTSETGSELQTSEKNLEQQTSETPTEPQTSEKSLKAQTSETTTEPQTSEKTTEPQTSKTTAEPQISEKNPEPQTSETTAEGQTSEKNPEPQTSETTAERQTSEKNPEPQTSETTAERQTSEKNPEPQTSETTAEGQTSEKNPEPQTSETTAERQTSEKNPEPQTSETTAERQTSEKNPEPQTSETTAERQTSEKNPEPQASETTAEPQTSELSKDPWIREENAGLQTSEKSVTQTANEVSTEPQTSKKSKDQLIREESAKPQMSVKSEKLQTSENKDVQLADKGMETKTREKSVKVRSREKSAKPRTMDKTTKSHARDKSEEPLSKNMSETLGTSEKMEEPLSSERSEEPASSETTQVPWTSKKMEEPGSSETTQAPWTSKKMEEPGSSETTQVPWTSEKMEEPGSSETTQVPWTSEKMEEPGSSETTQVPWTSEKMEEPASSETIQTPRTSEKMEEPLSSERREEPGSSEMTQVPLSSERREEPRSSETTQVPWTSEKMEEPGSSERREQPGSSETTQVPLSSERREEPGSSETTQVPLSSERREEPGSSETTQAPRTSEKRGDPWSTTLEPETEASGLFTTAVTEEKLKEAREKSQRRVFGSSQVFWQIEDRKDQSNIYSFPHIVQSRANEHYEAGLTLLSQGDTEEAIVAFSKAVNLCPDKIELYLKKAEAFLQLCDFQSAALNLKKACSAASPKEENLSLLAFTLYLQGQCLFDRGSYLGALESFTCASELQPWKPMYHLCSIACLAPLGRYADCLRLVSKLLEEDKLNPDLYVLRARLHYKFNKILLCYQDVGEALRLESDHRAAQAWRRYLKNQADEARALAVIKAVEGQLHEALSKIYSAIEHDPNDAEYYTFRGTLYRRLQDFSSAMDDFVLAMQLSGATETPPVATRAVDAPAELPVMRGPGESPPGRRTTYPAAGEQLSVFLEAQKQLLLTYNDFAVQCYKKGFYEEGVLLLNKAIKGQKHEMGLYMNRGDCLFQLGELSLALADYQQALELSPLDRGVRHRIAMLQNELGLQEQQQRRYHEAEVHFSRAIENQPRLAAYYLHRARVRLCLQEHAGAQEDALTALLLDSSSSEAEPLVMGFFPGKSLLEILSSKQCAATRERLERNLQTCPSSQLQDHSKRGKRPGTPRGAEDASDGGANGCSKLAQCLTDEGVYTEMVQGRKKINQEIQRVLQTKGDRMSSADRKAVQASKGSMAPEIPVHWENMGLTSALH
ncbi:tetratricopeptide repeat protein 16 [Lissotriton helveticus]